ncbi:PROTEIN SEY1 [Salix purpurea]|uniref:PROTEIN SEY1 n=1 Tax=Salix purpurea TaxID=77065 RepID=A0A9Q0VGL4_SALPP|nr:PROTEIN SEY1 [Salix purpurea]
MKMEEGMQLIDGNGNFNVEGLKDFMTTTGFAHCGRSYAIVAIIGPQSSGKSTLMNHVFGTNFKMLDAYKGRGQTTKGIWIARCNDIKPFTVAMDFEGTDSNARGEDNTAFERQSALFALAIADIILINMWYKDIGLEHAASRPLLKTVFQVMKRLFKPRKRTLLFVLRDHSKTPFEYLETALKEDIDRIWASVAEPETSRSVVLSDFFNVEIAALSSYEFEEKNFKEQVDRLRQRFFHSISPGGLAGDRRDAQPASGFALRAEQIWKTIKENKDLDLPAMEVMVATFRCEAIAEEKLKCFTSNMRWLAIKEDVQTGPVPGFGEDVTSILETCLSEYDIEVGHFDQEVRNAKRKQLLSNVLMVVHDAYDTMLMHLYSNTVNSFKTSLEQSLNEGREYVASIHLCSQSCLREFDEGCEDAAIQQSEWNANEFRKRLICNMLSEVMAKYKKQITHAIANTVESLLEASERNTWASVRDVFECNTEKAISEFSDAAASFDLCSSEINTKFQQLREYARNLLEMKAKEQADAGRVLKRMMDRSKQVFDNYEKSISWYKWTTETNLDEIERKALSKSLRILSILAAIRYDEMPDQIENVLYSSLMDRIVLNPSLQNTPMEAVLDPLAVDTWEEVSQNSTTLLKPEDCVSLWMTFIEEIKPMVTDVKSRQDARRKTRSNAALAARAVARAAVGVAVGAAAGAVGGPTAGGNLGIAFIKRVMRM